VRTKGTDILLQLLPIPSLFCLRVASYLCSLQFTRQIE